MREEPVRRKRKINGWRLVGAAFLAACLVVGVFWWRATETSASDARLCRKIDKLDSVFFASVAHSKPPKPGEYGYAYWKTHHETEPIGAPGGEPSPQLLALLRSAACDPKNLPSNNGGHP